MKKIFRLFISALIAINVLAIPLLFSPIPVLAEDYEIVPHWTDYATYSGSNYYSDGDVRVTGKVTLSYTYTSSGKTIKINSYSISVTSHGLPINTTSVSCSPSKGSIITTQSSVTIRAVARIDGQSRSINVVVPIR